MESHFGQQNDNENRLEKLHTYSSNNKRLIEKSSKCYCFHCKREMSSKEVTTYLSNEETALCPYCGIDAIIPDAINDELNDDIIDEMNKYWF